MPHAHPYNNLLVMIAVGGVIICIIALLFWFLHLSKHKSNPIYRIRHPVFWMCSLCTSCIQIIITTFLTHLRIDGHMPNAVLYFSLNAFTHIFIGFCFDLGRVLFLWYSLKLQRFEQDNLIKKHLAPSEDIDIAANPKNIPFIYRHSNFFSRPSRFFIALEMFMFVLYSIALSIVIASSSTHSDNIYQLGVHIILLSVSILILVLILLICQLWCCNSSSIKRIKQIQYTTTFRDTFRFRLEITLMMAGPLLIIPTAYAIIPNQYNVDVMDKDGIFGEVLLLIVEFIAITISICVQICVPYITFKQNISNFQRKDEATRHKSNSVSLLDVLCHRYGFYLFLDQLVQELCFENLLFLIEVYQFKKITLNMLNKKHLKQKRRDPKLGDNRSPTPSELTSDEEFSASFTSNIGRRQGSQYSEKIAQADVAYFNSILLNMPWIRLPLADSIRNAPDLDKLVQAYNIYSKYIDTSSYYALNIGGNACYQISQELNRLKDWKCSNKTQNEGGDLEQIDMKTENDMKNDKIQIETFELEEVGNTVKTEKQWNEMIVNVFDTALPDVFTNLDDCMDRFRLTGKFSELVGTWKRN
eukprot:152649_1